MAAAWRLVSSGAPGGALGGALAVFELTGDLDAAWRALGVRPVEAGGVGVRALPDADDVVIARADVTSALLTAHAGPAVVDAVARVLRRAGLREAREEECETLWGAAGAAVELSEIGRGGAERGGAEASIAESNIGESNAAESNVAESNIRESSVWALALRALVSAASPRAVDLLLDQPRRWAEARTRGPGSSVSFADGRSLARLLEPPMVVAVGWANAGKSTLLNAFADRAVAAVSPEPGTTRDHVGASLVLDGLAVRWVDTPGLRADADAMEREAWAIASGLVARAELVVLISTPEREPPELADVPGLVEVVCAGGRGERAGVRGEEGAGARAEGSVPLVVRVSTHVDVRAPVWVADAAVSGVSGAGLAELARTIRGALVPDAALADPRPWKFWGE